MFRPLPALLSMVEVCHHLTSPSPYLGPLSTLPSLSSAQRCVVTAVFLYPRSDADTVIQAAKVNISILLFLLFTWNCYFNRALGPEIHKIKSVVVSGLPGFAQNVQSLKYPTKNCRSLIPLLPSVDRNLQEHHA